MTPGTSGLPALFSTQTQTVPVGTSASVALDGGAGVVVVCVVVVELPVEVFVCVFLCDGARRRPCWPAAYRGCCSRCRLPSTYSATTITTTARPITPRGDSSQPATRLRVAMLVALARGRGHRAHLVLHRPLVAPLELIDEQPAVEPQVVAVCLQKALDVDGAGEQVPLLVLERAQVFGTDLRARLHLADIDARAHARLAQSRADLRHTREALRCATGKHLHKRLQTPRTSAFLAPARVTRRACARRWAARARQPGPDRVRIGLRISRAAGSGTLAPRARWARPAAIRRSPRSGQRGCVARQPR